ncbi:alpha/beta hydrolase [Streptomyces sp. NPDC001941]|uniref:alpha/beta fold hydrolase n=1 Tax=Streptomyces sp. NPDC001941 TaxID=3154659 RepID=UPI00331BE8C6
MTEPVTRTLDAIGATITYDVRDAGTPEGAGQPPLFLIGSPMGADGFATLASHFADRTVITYDPRCAGRSPRTDDASETLPEEHANDLRLVIEAVGAGPVDLFASSGGAVNALALVARHPELVRTLVAHEPPAASALPDRVNALAACEDVHVTYLRSGFGAAMAKFIALTAFEGEFPADWAERPAPDPSAFGMPTGDDGTRNDPLVGQNMRSCTAFAPDFGALRTASTRVVVGVGEESGEQMAARCGRAVAEGLGSEPVVFPSHHAGFLGGEYGQHGAPKEFAAKLRDVLAEIG